MVPRPWGHLKDKNLWSWPWKCCHWPRPWPGVCVVKDKTKTTRLGSIVIRVELVLLLAGQCCVDTADKYSDWYEIRCCDLVSWGIQAVPSIWPDTAELWLAGLQAVTALVSCIQPICRGCVWTPDQLVVWCRCVLLVACSQRGQIQLAEQNVMRTAVPHVTTSVMAETARRRNSLLTSLVGGMHCR